MKWNEDEEVWKKLTLLMEVVKEPLDDFLSTLYKYHDDIGIEGQAMIFGGIGNIVMAYNQYVKETNPEQALATAFQISHNDGRVKKMMGHSVEVAIDNKVKKMKGE